MLTRRISRQVSGTIQGRGRQYFHRGAVRILEGDARSVQATVQGTSPYRVKLRYQGDTITASCTCPYYEGNLEICKHIWATLLAAEARGYLSAAGARGPLYLEEDVEAGDGPGPGSWQDEEERNGTPLTTFRTSSRPPGRRGRAARGRKRRPRKPGWKERLARVRGEMERQAAPPSPSWPAGRQLLYIVDLQATKTGPGLTLEVAYRQRKKDGGWSKPKSERIAPTQIAQLPNPEDQQILALLAGAQQITTWSSYPYLYHDYGTVRYRLSEPQQEVLLPRLCQTGRCCLRQVQEDAEVCPLRWDEGPAWEFWLHITTSPTGKQYLLKGELRRGEERMDLTAPVLLTRGGLVFYGDRVARLQDFGAFDWMSLLRNGEPVAVPAGQKDKLLQEVLRLPRLPRLDLPEDLHFETVALTPQPRLKVKAPQRSGWGPERLRGELSFDYEGQIVPADQPGQGIYQAESRRFLLRDRAAEQAAAARLEQLGFRRPTYTYGAYDRRELELAPRNLPRVVRDLLADGWHVEAEGKLYRQPGAFQIEIRSGIDWFELHGRVSFGDTTADLPELLAALRRGEDTVRLGDGTFGTLPQEWLRKYGLLAGLGTVEGDHLRFRKTQVGLLDTLLAAQPQATCDAVFAQARDELRAFEGVQPADPPAGFVGQLRGYQREGLGWLYFLQKFGFGGCLADDMGLGKTVQVLALLESRRDLRAGGGPARPGPSLVVVPRSLVFNWKQEAARFTPQLRVLDHTGITRQQPGEHFEAYDLVLTTYGTLRRDALHFKDLTFDYCILDESQAIKNASTESAKAVRLLRADHRLALSGTPIENHLGELWSLFEFLNPGMLGSASVFRLVGGGAKPEPETRDLLARALRPFILRRTKEQVARDLPEKLEQTIYCELEPAQRKQYDQLREHYRRSLLGRVERDGLARSKIQILEALLRLRQAACHPGLIDKARTSEPSAKLDVLLPQLTEVIEEGHKALVFSQFTSLLAIVRERLDREHVRYEYLDGRTRDRASRVEHFQGDPTCPLFLISLKAGGLGLNLTAAEYVFLLDPWWNPAVEAQAIDRAHRIGQTRQVFAYRLIARDTVEEKVLELQQTKRELAASIISADNSLIRNLGREDLELLLS